jgi:methylated-DNA-protein-cysteine methyltransferase-like protein
MDTAAFYETVYALVRRIPAGRVVSYGQLAWMLHEPRQSRLVGRAMRCCAERDVPCHRVVNSQGRLVPGWLEQRRLLELEGVAFRENGCVDMKRCLWRPDCL